MPDDPVAAFQEQLNELRDEAERLANSLGNGPRQDETFDGADSQNLVRARLDGHGAVQAVAVNPQWRQRADPAQLAQAVLQAVASAQTARMTAWGTAVGESATTTTAPRVNGPPPISHPTIDPGPHDSAHDASPRDLIRSMLADLRNVEAELDDLHRRASENYAKPMAVRTDEGHVTATVRGGMVVSLELDTQWASTANRAQIGAEIHALFRLARVRVRDVLGDLPDGLRRLNALTDDPRKIFKRLGLEGTMP